MRETVLLGIGIEKFIKAGSNPNQSYEEMAEKPISRALADAGVTMRDIQAAFVGWAQAGMRTGRNVIQHHGWTGIPIRNTEMGCAGATCALIDAYNAVASGIYDIVLAVGYEKMKRGFVEGYLHPYHEAMGLGPVPVRHAAYVNRYIADFGGDVRQFAQAAVQFSESAVHNPNAQFQKAHTMEEILHSRPIVEPLTLLMCSPTSDGAAAAVVCSREKAKQIGGNGRAIKIAGWATASPDYHLEQAGECGIYPEGTSPTARAAKIAYERSGFGPKDINVAQVHDAFVSTAIRNTEDLGFCRQGEGGRWFLEGRTKIGGDIPINTDGGELNRGHPLGASGLAMTYEIVSQLRGEAGQRQVPGNPRVGLVHNSGSESINVITFQK